MPTGADAGADDDARALTSPVSFAGRVMHPDGSEHSEKRNPRQTHSNRHGKPLQKRILRGNRVPTFRSPSPLEPALYRGPYADIGDALRSARRRRRMTKRGRSWGCKI